MSEQQSRIGVLIGNGLAFVTEKTALTKSQWLMLALFATGAILVGLISTRQTYSSKPPPSSSDRSVLAASANTSTPTGSDAATLSAPKPSAMTGPATADQTASNLETAAAPAGLIAARPAAAEPNAPAPLVLNREIEQASNKPTASIDAGTKALFENLARDIARINQKLDDLAGKQRQTSTRLTALIAEGKQGRSRPADSADDRPEPTTRKASAPIAPKVARASAPPREHTVRPKRVVQRARSIDLRRAVIERELAFRRRSEVAERTRRVRRRRLASSLIFRPF